MYIRYTNIDLPSICICYFKCF